LKTGPHEILGPSKPCLFILEQHPKVLVMREHVRLRPYGPEQFLDPGQPRVNLLHLGSLGAKYLEGTRHGYLSQDESPPGLPRCECE